MLLTNANIFTKDCEFTLGTVYIADDKIKQVFTEKMIQAFPADEEIIDCKGQYLIPGLVDIHFHGCNGYDFCDGTEESLQSIADYEAENGILAICPATMTYSEEILNKVMDTAANYKNVQGADLVGINMEGPFISPNKIGAQNPKYVQKADYDMYKRLQERSGNLIKLITIAPEEEGALDFIQQASKEVVCSIGHTCTDYETAVMAFEAGATHLTHLYNAMPGINHRQPGPILAAVEAGAEVEIISDGIHLHDAAIRFAFEMFGWDKTILIADSCEATGLKDGVYQLGGQDIKVTKNLAVLARDEKTIAGSATNLYGCMKYAVQHAGIDLDVAVAAATLNPAKSIGIDDRYGIIASGKIANILLLDKDLNLNKVIRHGEILDNC